jgi:hypothetical protein
MNLVRLRENYALAENLANKDSWMSQHRIATVWVLSDNAGAEEFYKALGFERNVVQPVQLSRTTQEGG